MLALPAQDDVFSATSAQVQMNSQSYEENKQQGEQPYADQQQQAENGESIQLLINTFLETLDQHQDIQVIQKRLLGVANSKVAAERTRILNGMFDAQE